MKESIENVQQHITAFNQMIDITSRPDDRISIFMTRDELIALTVDLEIVTEAVIEAGHNYVPTQAELEHEADAAFRFDEPAFRDGKPTAYPIGP